MKTFNIYYKYRIIRDRYSNKNTSILLDQKNNQPDDSQILRRYLRINETRLHARSPWEAVLINHIVARERGQTRFTVRLNDNAYFPVAAYLDIHRPSQTYFCRSNSPEDSFLDDVKRKHFPTIHLWNWKNINCD